MFFRNAAACLITLIGLVTYIGWTASALACDDKAALVLPANNAQGVSSTPSLAINVPQVSLQNCSIDEVQWQIASDANFNNIVYNTGYISTLAYGIHNVPANTLLPATKYYWRVRLKLTLNDGPPAIPASVFSGWSSAFNFTTEALQIIQQCNWAGVHNKSPSNGAVVDTLTPTLEIEFFGAALAPVCQLELTEWEVSDSLEDLEAGAIVSSSRRGGADKMSYTVPANRLEDNKEYVWRVRLIGPNGEMSSWSAPTSFRIQVVSLIVVQRCSWFQFENSSPSDGQQNVSLNPTLEIQIPPNQAVQAPACEHEITRYQIATDANFNNVILDSDSFVRPFPRDPWELPNKRDGTPYLQQGTTYYWKAQLFDRDGNPSESPWSSPTSFTTLGQNNGNGNGNQQPPPNNNAQDLCDLDANQNGVLDDPEFFSAVDMWIGETIDNPLFFGAVDAWIGQSEVCAASASISGVIFNVSSSHNGVLFAMRDLTTAAINVEIYDTEGRQVFTGRSSGAALRWLMRSTNGALVSNGVYLYRVIAVSSMGEAAMSPVQKLIVLR